jgi:hypothetical protein
MQKRVAKVESRMNVSFIMFYFCFPIIGIAGRSGAISNSMLMEFVKSNLYEGCSMNELSSMSVIEVGDFKINTKDPFNAHPFRRSGICIFIIAIGRQISNVLLNFLHVNVMGQLFRGKPLLSVWVDHGGD